MRRAAPVALSAGDVCIYTDGMRVSVGKLSLIVAGWFRCDWTARRGTWRPRPIVVGRLIEQTVDEERQAHDHEEPADADALVHRAAGDADQHQQAEADAHQGDAGAAVTPGGAVAQAVVTVHRAIEPARVDLRRRHQPPFDQGDPLTHFELANARPAHRQHNDVREDADRADDRDEKGPGHLHVVHYASRVLAWTN